MKTPKHILFFFILFTTSMYAQDSDSTITLYGNLYNIESFKPVEFAHVVNLQKYKGTISDSVGNFQIKMEPGDTLFITAIGYEHKKYTYTGANQLIVFEAIPMEEKVYKIEKVEITPWGTYRDFKNKFISLDLKNPRDDIHPLIWKDLPEPPEDHSPQEPGLMNPISFLYYTFSQEGKSLRKLKKLQEEQPDQKKTESKYNKEIIKELTGLQGKELERFMKFCNFTDEYLLKTKQYDILKRVKEKYKDFSDSTNTLNENTNVPIDSTF